MLRRSILIAMTLCLGFAATASGQAAVTGTDLYSIDLESGKLTKVAELGDGEAVIGIALLSGVLEVGPGLALTTENEIFEFNVNAPGAIGDRLDITGLGAGESLKGIDYRPATGELWAISDKSKLYMIDLSSGEATSMGGTLDPSLADPNLGFDFNPVVDRIRVDVSTGQNLRLNPETGEVGVNAETMKKTVDGDLAYAEGDTNAGTQPKVVGAAYTNSQAGAQKTELYVIDVATQSLAVQAPPNKGTLNTVGPLGIDIVEWAAFDIAPSGEGYVTNPNLTGMPSTGSGVMPAGNGSFTWVLTGLVATVAVVALAGVTTRRKVR
jgi:hypothetical protein